MPAGRPSDYSEELAAEICELIIEGNSLRTIASLPDMPAVSTLWRWVSDNKQFQDHYARAKELQAEGLVDEMVQIADSAVDSDSAACARVRVDTRKWAASKLRPKKYGELVKHEHGGPDGGPIPVSIAVSYEKPQGS